MNPMIGNDRVIEKPGAIDGSFTAAG